MLCCVEVSCLFLPLLFYFLQFCVCCGVVLSCLGSLFVVFLCVCLILSCLVLSCFVLSCLDLPSGVCLVHRVSCRREARWNQESVDGHSMLEAGNRAKKNGNSPCRSYQKKINPRYSTKYKTRHDTTRHGTKSKTERSQK